MDLQQGAIYVVDEGRGIYYTFNCYLLPAGVGAFELPGYEISPGVYAKEIRANRRGGFSIVEERIEGLDKAKVVTVLPPHWDRDAVLASLLSALEAIFTEPIEWSSEFQNKGKGKYNGSLN